VEAGDARHTASAAEPTITREGLCRAIEPVEVINQTVGVGLLAGLLVLLQHIDRRSVRSSPFAVIQYETRPPRWRTFRNLNGCAVNFDAPSPGRRDQLRTPVDHAFATYLGRLAANVKDGSGRGTKLAGRQMCRMLYTGQPSSAVIDTMAAQHAASPDQSASVLRAARGTLCTQAPG
jgi:hypothetical protein